MILGKIKYYLSVLKQICIGLFNFIFKPGHVELVRQYRKGKCNSCMFNSSVMKLKDKNFKTRRIDEHCLLCKCNLFLKQYSKSKCPNGIW